MNGNEYKACAGPADEVSFYNVEARFHIYTFNDTFTEKLYPYFSPYLNQKGRNASPLISPVCPID
ncbi:A33 protein, partial [Amia calva]|nr:A33 protein [Amia calva]